jgi:TolA-binding protein
MNMLDRLITLEEKLSLLLQRFASAKKENQRLKSMLKSARKVKKPSEEGEDFDPLELLQEREELALSLEQSQNESRQLQKKINELEKILQEKNELERETAKKVQAIIARIDTLEAEIGELENEQTNSNKH